MLEEIDQRLFGSRPQARLVFSGSMSWWTSFIEAVPDTHREDLRGLGLSREQEMVLASNLHPVLFVCNRIPIEEPLDAEGADRLIGCYQDTAVEYEYQTLYAPRNGLVKFIRHLAADRSLDLLPFQHRELRFANYFTAGEALCFLTVGLVPIPPAPTH